MGQAMTARANAARLPIKTMLEEGTLPVEDLVCLALREGRRPRPIYTAHKWFARRLGVVFRSLLVGATQPPGADFWASYYGDSNLQDLTVLDPFVGGGTSVVEAQRLGASVAAADVDPIACAITRFELAAHEIPNLHEALSALMSSVGGRLQRYHELNTDSGEPVQVLHHFWVQKIHCDACDASFHAHPNYWLAKMPGAAWALCGHCGETHAVNADVTHMVCSACGERTDLDSGHIHFGKATCPSCKKSVRLIDLGRDGKEPPKWELFAHEVLDEPDGGRAVPMAKRRFLPAREDSRRRFEAACRELTRLEKRGAVESAGGPIVVAAQTDTRLQDYGYRDWRDLYNARQRLHLATLAKAISEHDEPVRHALAMAFSDHLTTNCMLTSYASGWRRLTPLFSIRGFRHVPRPVEINPWIDGTGRGTYPNAVKKLLRAREFARSPKEPEIEGGFRSVASRAPQLEPRVHTGSSKDLSFLPDASIDIVLTDPPYFDNIAYSELAEFFLPWLRHFGIVVDEGVDRVLLDSLVSRRANRESIATYREGLMAVFGEVSRVLKPGGILVFSFRHSLPEAWESLAAAIHPHPLICARVLPLPGETGTGLHVHEGAGLWDAVFVLRRVDKTRRRRGPSVSKDARASALVDADGWARRLASSPIRFGQPDIRTIRMASLVGASLQNTSSGPPLVDALSEAMEMACPV